MIYQQKYDVSFLLYYSNVHTKINSLSIYLFFFFYYVCRYVIITQQKWLTINFMYKSVSIISDSVIISKSSTIGLCQEVTWS